MTTESLSNEFDVLLNAYSTETNTLSTQLDEYEKSVFLSQAQKEVIVSIYSGRNNKGISFESTEESRRLLHKLTRRWILDNIATEVTEIEISTPEDLFFVTHESAEIQIRKGESLQKFKVLVVPTNQDDLDTTLNNPFKGPNKNRILRLDINESIKLISNYPIASYTIDYIAYPKPIITTNLEDLDIDGYNTPEEFELDFLKDEILNTAVLLALKSKGKLK